MSVRESIYSLQDHEAVLVQPTVDYQSHHQSAVGKVCLVVWIINPNNIQDANSGARIDGAQASRAEGRELESCLIQSNDVYN